MTTTLERTSTPIRSLSDVAMLVDLTIRQWNAGRTDSQATEAVANTFNTDRRSGHYYKRLLQSEYLTNIRRISNQAYLAHTKRTLPWLDNGHRILSSKGYFDYMEAMSGFTDEFNRAVDLFVDHYTDLIDEDRRRQRSLFKIEDYPRITEIRDKFALEISIFPLPSSGDFRVEIDPSEIARIQRSMDEQLNAMTRNATQDLVNRIVTAVTHMHDRMEAYTGTREGSFRDSLVDNMRELADLVPTLNITNDPILEEIARRMHDLVTYDPDTLRKNSSARSTVADTADDILAKMKQFI